MLLSLRFGRNYDVLTSIIAQLLTSRTFPDLGCHCHRVPSGGASDRRLPSQIRTVTNRPYPSSHLLEGSNLCETIKLILLALLRLSDLGALDLWLDNVKVSLLEAKRSLNLSGLVKCLL